TRDAERRIATPCVGDTEFPVQQGRRKRNGAQSACLDVLLRPGTAEYRASQPLFHDALGRPDAVAFPLNVGMYAFRRAQALHQHPNAVWPARQDQRKTREISQSIGLGVIMAASH